MGTKYKDFLLVLFTICVSLGISNGCQMEDVNNWFLWQNVEILDIFEGVVVRRSTSDILGIASVSFSPNIGPYMDVSLTESAFVIQTNERFKTYEEYETARSINIATTFNCVGGSTRSLTFSVEIIDTNNNDPIFRPNDTYQFTVTPPLPPGYAITSLLSPLIVRDIDLTTQQIDFEIFDNSNFLINYDEVSPATPKEFRASLRTTTLIRSIPEPIEFVISATDVDLTGDPRRTRNATVRILSDGSFELPEELVFTQSFYLAEYTENNEILLREPISLQQGFHGDVTFSLITGENSEYFEIVPNGNNITLRVIKSIPVELLTLRKLFLVIRADRQYTSGTSATVVVQLPEDVTLQFEKSVYEGAIIDNELQLSDLVLSQGYENQTVSIQIQSEFASFFTYKIYENNITLSMSTLDATTIIENAFLNLQIIASTNRSVASTVITLEIIKNDKTTPMFEHTTYIGKYDPVDGLTLEKIVIVQGYDDTVEVKLAQSDHAQYFSIVPNGPYFELIASNLPPEIYSEGPLLLTIVASKPRTVGANAAISIILPTATNLSFLQENYRGIIQENNLRIETIKMSKYVTNVLLDLTGDYADFFKVTSEEGEITLEIQDQLPESAVLENDFLLLSLSATAMNANNATTTILLEIIKEDTTTPVFNDKIYSVIYSNSTNYDVSRIFLTQGYDETVSFHITGEHSEYFTIRPSGNDVELTISKTIPEELIFKEKVLVFNIVAEKPLTVGARAAITVHFPLELTEPIALAFSKTFYTGSLEDTVLRIEDIELSVGFTTNTIFTINGEYKNYFQAYHDENFVKISQINTLPPEIIDYKYIALELEAQRERAVPVSAIIIIDIVQPEPIVPPVFSEPFYRAVYTEETGLDFKENISLSQGFDDTVIFELEGEYKDWFEVTNDKNLVIISVNDIPENILDTNHHLVFSVIARKVGVNNVIDGRAAIVIDLPKESPELVLLRFTQPSYVGSIQNNILNLPPVTLAGIYDMAIALNTTGEYSSYFKLTLESNVVNVELISDLPSEIIDTIITITIEASYPGAVSGFTTLVIALEKEPEIQFTTPVFERAYYFGEYLHRDQLVFENTIQLIQGFDNTVSFTLEGDDSKYFKLIFNSQNNITLSVTDDSIDEVNDRTHLLFSIIAKNMGTVNGKAAIVITLPDINTGRVLSFERNYYVGLLNGTNVNLPQIVLNEGFSSDVRFSLVGELAPFFILQDNLATLTISLANAIPEDSIPANGIIIIQVEATAPQVLPAYTSIILEVTMRKEDLPTAIEFEETHYVGNFSTTEGLIFDRIITLAEGYDESVEFDLEGGLLATIF
ncbi:unnamed protein product [Chilo suppressalis]|uniref:Cadherin domain-containing protein n=1 Tax=Chilo suppressalis TaxID=168631 RepID=A0ABN8BG36_CHISP|nr:unnamed protein product [Chilo suppressalis]